MHLLELKCLLSIATIMLTVQLQNSLCETNNNKKTLGITNLANLSTLLEVNDKNSDKKKQDDIETIRRNVEHYNKLFSVDKQKLTEQQRNILERIVERVSRLKENFDINLQPEHRNDRDNNNGTKNSDINTSLATELISSSSSSLSNLPSSSVPVMPSSVSTTGSSEDAELKLEPKLDQNEARGNNNNQGSHSHANFHSTTRTGNSNKIKVRQQHNSTKRPLSSTRPTANRTSGHRLSAAGKLKSKPKPALAATVAVEETSSSSVASALGTFINNNGQKTVGTSNVTIQPHHHLLLRQQQQQHQLREDQKELLLAANRHPNEHLHQTSSPSSLLLSSTLTAASGSVPISTLSGNTDSLGTIDTEIYDSNATTTSIINKLANQAREDYYNNNNGQQNESDKLKKPASGIAKPTKYHYYPHNQHIYLLPECAIQQVCNAVYVRLNYTQPLCACPSRYRDPCSASLNEDDLHTTKLIGDGRKRNAITLAKTCETTTEMRECRAPKDWSLLALQNTRTGKSHYLVICKCPDHYKLEGPMAHDQPTYASVPGIRVFGMMCVKPGYSTQKPGNPLTKRYQTQKPYFMTTIDKYDADKNIRQNYLQQDSYHNQQHQQQSSYQYLHRPENSPTVNPLDGEYKEPLVQFNGVYGRHKQIEGDSTDATLAEEETFNISTTTPIPTIGIVTSSTSSPTRSLRTKRQTRAKSDNIPDFPWHKVQEFQKSIIWV